MVRSTRLTQRAVRALIVLLLVAVAVAAALLNLPGGDGGSNPELGGQPWPPLFPDAKITLVDRIAAPAQARAMRDANRWLHAHPTRDDAAFMNYALSRVGAPPSGAAQRRELAQLHRLDLNRTATGTAAAVWLEAHGKKDVWKLYRKQYQQLVAPAVGVH